MGRNLTSSPFHCANVTTCCWVTPARTEWLRSGEMITPFFTAKRLLVAPSVPSVFDKNRLKSFGLLGFLLGQHVGKQIEAFDVTAAPPNIRDGDDPHTPLAYFRRQGEPSSEMIKRR